MGIGLPNAVPGSTGEQLVEWARRADVRGFSCLGTIDRIVYDNYEPLVALAAAAAVTERIGLCTSALLGPLRPNAAELAKQAPRRPRGRWSKINREKVEALIAAGRMRPAGLTEVEAAKADGRWEAAYEGQRTAKVPPDLKRELDARPVAREFFEGLSSQNRYAILYRLGDAKRPETRERRLRKFVAMLERGETLHP